jgi:hypothetical protein
MSFDIFVQCFEHGNASRFPLSMLDEAFGRFVIRREAKHWDLEYAER